MICEHFLLIIPLHEPELIFVSQLNGLKYFYQIRIILFTINHLFAPQLNGTTYCYVCKNSNKLPSFVYTQLSVQIAPFS